MIYFNNKTKSNRNSCKAQVTIFIAVGLIILFFVALSVFFSSVDKTFTDQESLKPLSQTQIIPIKEYVDSCVKKTSEEGILSNSLQGGYYNVPEPNTDQAPVKIPYYFDLGKNNLPKKEIIEKELEMYINAELPKCINHFASFKEVGYLFETGDIKAKASMKKVISVEVEYPIKAIKGDSVFKLNSFYHIIDVDFTKIYSIISETMIEQEKTPNYVPIGYLSFAAFKNNFKFGLSYLEDGDVIYSYIFENYLITGKNYTFIFASRYDWHDLMANISNDKIDINAKDQHCYVGDMCSYNLNIFNDDSLIFEDHTNLFDISKEGWIKFIPKQGEIGKHSILVKVKDKVGSEKYLTFTLEIIPFNNQPRIEEITEQKAKVGQLFVYQTIANDPDEDEIVFFDDTDMFDISNDGLITFIPAKEDEGLHLIKITVSDGELEDDMWMYLNVIN